MVRKGLLLAVPFVAALSGCVGEIPVVGLDAEGKAIETMAPKRKFVAGLTENVDKMSDSVIPVADSEQYGRLMSGLRGIRLGLGLKGSAGLGDYWKLGGNIGFNLHFSNKE